MSQHTGELCLFLKLICQYPASGGEGGVELCICKNYAIHQTIPLLTGNGIRILFCLCFGKNLSFFNVSKQRGSSIQTRHLKGLEYGSVWLLEQACHPFLLTNTSSVRIMWWAQPTQGSWCWESCSNYKIWPVQKGDNLDTWRKRVGEIIHRHTNRNSKTFIFLLRLQHIEMTNIQMVCGGRDKSDTLILPVNLTDKNC